MGLVARYTFTMQLRRFFSVAFIFFVCFGASVMIARAWTGPTATPPGSNVAAPLNVGTNAQFKGGGLAIGQTLLPVFTFEANGSSLINGALILYGVSRYLNFGTNSGTAGYGFRDNAGVMEYKNNTGAWTSIAASGVWTTSGTNIYNSNTGNVGIGTAAPSAKLHVQGTTRISNLGGSSFIELGQGQTSNQYAYIDLVGDSTYTDYGLRLLRGNGGANTWSDLVHRGTGALNITTVDAAAILFKTTNVERARITAAGNVGIGAVAPKEKLQIGNAIAIHDGGHKALSFNAYYSSGWKYLTTESAFQVEHDTTDDRLDFNYAASGTADAAATVATAMSINTSGNVGIGVTAPLQKLDVNGNVNVPTGSCYMVNGTCITTGGLSGGGTGFLPIWTSATALGNSIIAANASSATVGGNLFTTGILYAATGFLMNGTDKHYLYSDGVNAVGLRINNGGTATAYLGFKAIGGLPAVDGAGGTLLLSTAGVERARITNTGNVGIGTAAPNEKIEIAATAGARGIFSDGGGASRKVVLFEAPGTTHAGYGRIAAHDYGAGSGLDLVLNDTGGNVGIGVTAPTQKLHVNGNVNVPTGSCYMVNGVCITSGGLGGSGTLNYVSKFSPNGTTLANSLIFDNGTNVGIGSATPDSKLEVFGTGASPSLSSDVGIFKVSGNITQELAFGEYTAAPFAFWMQTKKSSNDGSSWPLAINPLGGNVGIGTANPIGKLDVSNGTSNMYVGFASTNYPRLYLGGTAASGVAGIINKVNTATTLYFGEPGDTGGYQFRGTGTFYAQGGVGIGTLSPETKLHVVGNQRLDGTLLETDVNTANGVAQRLGLYNWDGDFVLANFTGTTWTSNRMTIDVNGNVIASGNVNADAFIYNSDARLKKDVASLSGNLHKVLQLKPVTYLWKDTSNYPEGTQIGFIAQDVEKIEPTVVHTDDEGMKAIDYARLTPLLVGSVQELNAKVEAQQKQIDELREKIEDIVGE